MELTERNYPAVASHTGEGRLVLDAGDKIRVQTWDPVNGIVDVLAETTVPTGKEWAVTVSVAAIETDA